MGEQRADVHRLALFADILRPFASTVTHLDISIHHAEPGIVAEWLVKVIGDEIPLLRFLRVRNVPFVRALYTYVSQSGLAADLTCGPDFRSGIQGFPGDPVTTWAIRYHCVRADVWF